MCCFQLNGLKGHTSAQWITNRELLCYTFLPSLSSLNLPFWVVSTWFVNPGTTWVKEVLESTILGDRNDHFEWFDCEGRDEEEDKSLDKMRSRIEKSKWVACI